MDTRIIDLNRDIVKSSLDSLIRVFSNKTDILFKNTPQQYPLYKDLSDFCKIYFEFYENNRQIIKDIGEEEDDNYKQTIIRKLIVDHNYIVKSDGAYLFQGNKYNTHKMNKYFRNKSSKIFYLKLNSENNYIAILKAIINRINYIGKEYCLHNINHKWISTSLKPFIDDMLDIINKYDNMWPIYNFYNNNSWILRENSYSKNENKVNDDIIKKKVKRSRSDSDDVCEKVIKRQRIEEDLRRIALENICEQKNKIPDLHDTDTKEEEEDFIQIPKYPDLHDTKEDEVEEDEVEEDEVEEDVVEEDVKSTKSVSTQIEVNSNLPDIEYSEGTRLINKSNNDEFIRIASTDGSYWFDIKHNLSHITNFKFTLGTKLFNASNNTTFVLSQDGNKSKWETVSHPSST